MESRGRAVAQFMRIFGCRFGCSISCFDKIISAWLRSSATAVSGLVALRNLQALLGTREPRLCRKAFRLRELGRSAFPNCNIALRGITAKLLSLVEELEGVSCSSRDTAAKPVGGTSSSFATLFRVGEWLVGPATEKVASAAGAVDVDAASEACRPFESEVLAQDRQRPGGNLSQGGGDPWGSSARRRQDVQLRRPQESDIDRVCSCIGRGHLLIVELTPSLEDEQESDLGRICMYAGWQHLFDEDLTPSLEDAQEGDLDRVRAYADRRHLLDVEFKSSLEDFHSKQLSGSNLLVVDGEVSLPAGEYIGLGHALGHSCCLLEALTCHPGATWWRLLRASEARGVFDVPWLWADVKSSFDSLELCKGVAELAQGVRGLYSLQHLELRVCDLLGTSDAAQLRPQLGERSSVSSSSEPCCGSAADTSRDLALSGGGSRARSDRAEAEQVPDVRPTPSTSQQTAQQVSDVEDGNFASELLHAWEVREANLLSTPPKSCRLPREVRQDAHLFFHRTLVELFQMSTDCFYQALALLDIYYHRAPQELVEPSQVPAVCGAVLRVVLKAEDKSKKVSSEQLEAFFGECFCDARYADSEDRARSRDEVTEVTVLNLLGWRIEQPTVLSWLRAFCERFDIASRGIFAESVGWIYAQGEAAMKHLSGHANYFELPARAVATCLLCFGLVGADLLSLQTVRPANTTEKEWARLFGMLFPGAESQSTLPLNAQCRVAELLAGATLADPTALELPPVLRAAAAAGSGSEVRE